MLQAAILKIRPDKVDRLRWWMGELNRRQDEVRETFRQESVQHEKAYLLDGRDGPLLLYLAELTDPDQARRAFRESSLPIDLEHRRIMDEVIDGNAPAEQLYECRAV